MHAARFQSYIDGGDLADEHRHVGHAISHEAFLFHSQLVLSGRQIGKLVIPVIGGFGDGDGPGGMIRGRNFRLRNRRAGGIHDHSGNSALFDLGKAEYGIRGHELM